LQFGTLTHKLVPQGFSLPVIPELENTTVGNENDLHKNVKLKFKKHGILLIYLQVALLLQSEEKAHVINIPFSQLYVLNTKLYWQMGRS